MEKTPEEIAAEEKRKAEEKARKKEAAAAKRELPDSKLRRWVVDYPVQMVKLKKAVEDLENAKGQPWESRINLTEFSAHFSEHQATLKRLRPKMEAMRTDDVNETTIQTAHKAMECLKAELTTWNGQLQVYTGKAKPTKKPREV